MSNSTAERLTAKTPAEVLAHELMTDFGYSRREAEAVVAAAQEAFGLGREDRPETAPAGTYPVYLARQGTTHARPVAETERVAVTWTVDAGVTDRELLSEFGKVHLRQVRLLRLVDEALEQGGAPTQEDLARALAVGLRTVRRDIQALEKQGQWVATRGRLQGIGRGQTHKARIVELYLKRYSFQQIQARTRHSPQAIERYVKTFARVVFLHQRGLPAGDIAASLQLGEGVIAAYLALYEELHPQYPARVAEIVARMGRPEVGVEKGGTRR